jgi:uncharacterized protein YndB with AHSA1/START domain
MITLEHAVKISAPREAVFSAFTDHAKLAGWHIEKIEGEVAPGKTVYLERRPGLRFGWKTEVLDAGKKIVQTCVEGPGSSVGKKLTILFSDEPDGRPLLRLSDSGWHENDEHLPLCNSSPHPDWSRDDLQQCEGISGFQGSSRNGREPQACGYSA